MNEPCPSSAGGRALRIALLALLANVAQGTEVGDACRAALPESLATAVAHQYPDFRAPLATDNDPADVAENRGRGGSGCLGLARADLDGDGVTDYVLGLAPLAGLQPLAVIALARGEQWVFRAIDSEVRSRVRLFVDVVPPGRYDRSETLGPPHRADEQRVLLCPLAGAIVGAVHATGIVYCLVRGNWRRAVVVG
ncbi:MAG: hypothetical protein IT480_12290 [Gammaproteobacteria bacterium]|nr:hypothetical protein [Gammaproteobacteria bacterium]